MERKIEKWIKQQQLPREVYVKAYEYGVFAPEYPEKYGGTPFEGKAWDNMMKFIRCDELMRACEGGLYGSLFVHAISVPPVLQFGNKEQKQMFADVIKAKKIAALAISESRFGSDVANIETTARRDETGEYFIVNGNKKWISNGVKADYYVVKSWRCCFYCFRFPFSFVCICVCARVTESSMNRWIDECMSKCTNV